MYARSAELYDLIYTSLKDYAAEARWLAVLIGELAPNARRLLDVGDCWWSSPFSRPEICCRAG